MCQLLGPSQVAKLLDVHPATVRRWAVEGKLTGERAGWGRVFAREEVQRFAEERRRKRHDPNVNRRAELSE